LKDDPSNPEEQIVDNAPCIACGCLCDDIKLTVRAGAIVAATRACAKGEAWFLKDRESPDWPDATIDGQGAAAELALSRAAAILREARSPVVIGLSQSSCEAQGAAVALADRIGAVVALSHENQSRARLEAFQRVGRVSASLGEVKMRADVIVFWGVDPVVTHPRHFERYSVDATGRFAPETRTVLVADDRETETMRRASEKLVLGPGKNLEAIQTLRAILRGLDVGTGPVVGALGRWVEILKSARYGALFFGARFGENAFTSLEFESLMMLARELNDHTRFVALPLGRAGNEAGAENVLAWQAGYPSAVNLARGYPSFEPERGSIDARLKAGEFDAAVTVGDVDTIDGLDRIPTIAIGPTATSPGTSCTVGLATSTPGIGGGGTVMRPDGVVLPLRPALSSSRPEERRWLLQLGEALR
jgi:formylmethanofuran dehydrogenase subunit B